MCGILLLLKNTSGPSSLVGEIDLPWTLDGPIVSVDGPIVSVLRNLFA